MLETVSSASLFRLDSQIELENLAINELLEHLKRKDIVTYEHSEETAVFAYILAIYAGYSWQEAERIKQATRLHDIGKEKEDIQRLIHQERSLTSDEFEAVKGHTVYGVHIGKQYSLSQDILDIIELHHENWDGTGFPYGLRGKDIPENARIVRIVDSVSAIQRNDMGGKPLSLEALHKDILGGFGSKYDPGLRRPYEGFYNNPWVNEHLFNNYQQALKRFEQNQVTRSRQPNP